MRYLTLVIALSTGDNTRETIPAWECRAAETAYEQTVAAGNLLVRDEDDAVVLSVECVAPTFMELLGRASDGPCEADA